MLWTQALHKRLSLTNVQRLQGLKATMSKSSMAQDLATQLENPGIIHTSSFINGRWQAAGGETYKVCFQHSWCSWSSQPSQVHRKLIHKDLARTEGAAAIQQLCVSH